MSRPKGSTIPVRRKKDTITLYQEDWDKLDNIGPSRGKAVERMLNYKPVIRKLLKENENR